MKSFLKGNRALIALILVSVIAATTVIGTRIGIERDNKTYDIVLDYDEISNMAEQSDMTTEEWLNAFKKMGITKVGLQEENIMTLMDNCDMPVSGYVMADIMKEADWRDDFPSAFLDSIEKKGGPDRFDVVIRTGDRAATEFIRHGLTSRMHDDVYTLHTDGDTGYFWIDGNSGNALYSEKYKYMNSQDKGFSERIDVIGSKIMYISLGLMKEKVEKIQSCGMDIIPRTLSYSGFNDRRYAEAVVSEYERYGIKPEYMIAGGEAVIGYDDGSDFAKDYIDDNNVKIGLIENTTQRQNIMQYGVEEAARATDFETVRVFTVWNYIQYRYQYYGYEGAKEIENTLFRAITERNIRVIYFKPFLECKDLHTYVTDIDEYEEMFDNLAERLAEHGFSMGSASVMKENNVARPLQMMICIGAALGAVLVLRSILVIKKKTAVILSVIGAAAVPVLYFAMPGMAPLITSFGCAVVFACIAVTFYTAQTKMSSENMAQDTGVFKIIPYSAAVLAVSVMISLIGGIMTAAPLSSTSFMLEIDIFRGVKISQLLPIAYFIIAFLAYYGYGASKSRTGHLEWNDIKELLDLRIRAWMVLAAGFAGLVGVYYIMRTGHDSSIEVSGTEMLFRNALEELLIARPRTKEFMFAFPAVMMMLYCAVRRLKLFTLVFGLAGVIGMTSVINTFMHLRTPLYLGFARTAYSLVFGVILGALAMLIFEVLYRIYLRYVKKYV